MNTLFRLIGTIPKGIPKWKSFPGVGKISVFGCEALHKVWTTCGYTNGAHEWDIIRRCRLRSDVTTQLEEKTRILFRSIATFPTTSLVDEIRSVGSAEPLSRSNRNNQCVNKHVQ